jgi:PAS domain S-box-containing protein
MPWVEALSDLQQLRRCIRDLVALSTLPVIWAGYGPQQIGDSIAAALVPMLDADFVYVALPRSNDPSLLEIIHPADGMAVNALSAVRAAMGHELRRSAEQVVEVTHPSGNGNIRVVRAPIGTGGEAALMAGSARQPDFPNEVQRLLLSIAANNATVALQRWQAETDEKRFVSLVERSSDFIGFANMDGKVQYVNPAGLILVGLSHIGRNMNVLDFLAADDRERAGEELWPNVARTGRWVGEIRFRHFQTGNIIPFLVDWFRIDNPHTNQPMNIATVSRDLTAHKQAEAAMRNLNESLENRVAGRTSELAAANESLKREMSERHRADARSQELQRELSHAGRLSTAGHMAASLAHEVNQPLTAVTNSINAARLLLANGGYERLGTIREITEEAAKEALRVGQIIRRLREFVTRGETEKNLESSSEMIKDASSFAQTGADALGIRVTFDLDPNITTVFVNRVQIQQVLVNLIRNAIEAMTESETRLLHVSTRRMSRTFIEIAIADSGPGISPDVAPHLFEPFISTKLDGMGLGLSICRSIVEAHEGELWNEANPAGGTIFRFTLPLGVDGGEP